MMATTGITECDRKLEKFDTKRLVSKIAKFKELIYMQEYEQFKDLKSCLA